MSIPAPPPRKATRKQIRPSDGPSKPATFIGAMVIGAAMGAASYYLLHFIADYFDYWIAVLVS